MQLCGCDIEFVDVQRYINEMVGVDNEYYVSEMQILYVRPSSD